jgi:prepilin-type N-terminal cleavage/methylation domain-containing protein
MGESMKKYGNRRKGFTLIEMLVVVAIIVALLAIIGFAGPALTKGAKVAAWKGSVKNIETALSIYLQNNGTLPDDALATGKIDIAFSDMGISKYMTGNVVDPFDPNLAEIHITNNVDELVDLTEAKTGDPILCYSRTADTYIDAMATPPYAPSYIMVAYTTVDGMTIPPQPLNCFTLPLTPPGGILIPHYALTYKLDGKFYTDDI